MQIIDFHTHVGNVEKMRDDIKSLLLENNKRQKFDINATFSSPEGLQKYYSEHNISHAVILAEEGPGTNYHITSEFVVDFCKEANAAGSVIFLPFGSINPAVHKNLLEKHKSDTDLGIKGFKLYPADHDFNPCQNEIMSVYTEMEKARQTLMFHTGFTAQKDGNQTYANPLIFEPILKRFPDLNVVLCHAGKPDHYQEAAELAVNYKNCYLDTALVPLEEFVATTTSISFPDLIPKILHGTDFPILRSINYKLAELESIGLNAEQIDRIVYRNAANLLGISSTL